MKLSISVPTVFEPFEGLKVAGCIHYFVFAQFFMLQTFLMPIAYTTVILHPNSFDTAIDFSPRRRHRRLVLLRLANISSITTAGSKQVTEIPHVTRGIHYMHFNLPGVKTYFLS